MAVVKELIRTEENGSPNWNVMECLYMSPYREQPYFL